MEKSNILTDISNNITKAVGKTKVMAKANAPEILIGIGVVGVVGAAVWACKKTLELPEAMAESKADIALTKEAYSAEEDIINDKKHPEHKEYVKQITKSYAFAGWRVVKIYAGPVILGTVSLGTIFAGTVEGRKMYAGAVAAGAAYETAYKNVLKRVEDEYGKEAMQKIKFGMRQEEVTETETTKSGKTKEIKKTVNVVEFDPNDPSTYSPYAKFFDESCAEWRKSSEYNLYFLQMQQKAANDRLRAQGYLFLNDVYDMLGIPRTEAGQMVGWVYDGDNPVGDNYVDFGLYEVRRESVRDFVNGYERSILLDFNVDGNIINRFRPNF